MDKTRFAIKLFILNMLSIPSLVVHWMHNRPTYSNDKWTIEPDKSICLHSQV